MKLVKIDSYLLLIDEEAEIKVKDYYYSKNNNTITTCDSIEEVEECKVLKGNDFKIIAYRKLNSEAKELDLPLLPNPFNLEQYAWNNPILSRKDVYDLFSSVFKDKVLTGAYNISASKQINEFNFKLREISKEKAAQSKQFSLEDMRKAIRMAQKGYDEFGESGFLRHVREHTETEIIQSLSTQQLPKEFIPEYINANSYGSETNGYDSDNFIPKTITNSEGKEEIQGKYVY